jgi:hypothetical protein
MGQNTPRENKLLVQWIGKVCVKQVGSPKLLMMDEMIDLATREEERIH